MDSQSVIKFLAQSEEDIFLLRHFLDKEKQRTNKNIWVSTKFLNPLQRDLCERLAQTLKISGFGFFGGVEQAERKIAVFYPEYLDFDSVKEKAAVALRCKKSSRDSLAHKDYLGALMGMGIVRESIGDIFVHEYGADLVVVPEIKDFLLLNFNKAGRKELSIFEIGFDEIIAEKKDTELKTMSVSSLRLDCISGAVWNLSRGSASEYIQGGKVFLNGYECKKPDKEVGLNDKISIRGKGKAVFKTIEGTSKKGKLRITIEKTK